MIKINYYHQKKERFFRRTKKVILFIALACIAIWGFFWIPYFKISNIATNNNLIRKSQISSALALFLNKKNNFFVPRDNFFLFSSAQAEQLILENDLGVAKISKKFPNKIELEFLEIKPKFIYCDTDCFYADKNGFLYENAPKFSENPIPLIEIDLKAKIGDYILLPKEALLLTDFLSNIEKIGLNANRIKSEKDFKIFLEQGWHIILLRNETRQGEKLAEKLKLILEQKIKDSALDYIDMRFPNKAFYKLK